MTHQPPKKNWPRTAPFPLATIAAIAPECQIVYPTVMFPMAVKLLPPIRFRCHATVMLCPCRVQRLRMG
jgi:hypothetical protein